ncbi:putative lycopene cyclase [Alloactinosynnema sp. L-07]|uniref:lycopene cyclase family protein n=1 Tax=Alloactinosynnema sp. L-07 TaxID=1653480 RepID=UPI00065EF11D|nr:lycopene cyclase family protein [Alloactinosynnema sp. L-07]CRK56378.1 putative lycopene cyclase [Alloactinosynnema sp. L-07]
MISAVDVVVVGAGPAGWALAHHCVGAGLDTMLVDPAPFAPWPATYGLWLDQCAALPADSYIRVRTVHAGGRPLDRGYCVLRNDVVLAGFSRGVTVVTGQVTAADRGPHGVTVALADGTRIACAVAVDASGARRVLSGGPLAGPRAEQTAFGVIVPAASFVPAGEAVFMDHWATVGGLATFLYAVPLPDGRVLLEETSLAARPGVPRAVLRDRLAARGVDMTGPVEWVRFALDVPPPWRGDAVAFGAAAGMIHPATGYSLGDAFALAPRVAAAIADAPRGKAGVAARQAVWSPRAQVVHRLRSRGLRTLLALPADRHPQFFESFFTLPSELRDAYLTGREDVRGTAAAMAAVFRAVPWGIRKTILLLR